MYGHIHRLHDDEIEIIWLQTERKSPFAIEKRSNSHELLFKRSNQFLIQLMVEYFKTLKGGTINFINQVFSRSVTKFNRCSSLISFHFICGCVDEIFAVIRFARCFSLHYISRPLFSLSISDLKRFAGEMGNFFFRSFLLSSSHFEGKFCEKKVLKRKALKHE